MSNSELKYLVAEMSLRGGDVVSDLKGLAILLDHSRHGDQHDGLNFLDGTTKRTDERRDKEALREKRQVCLVHKVHGEEAKTEHRAVVGQGRNRSKMESEQVARGYWFCRYFEDFCLFSIFFA